MIIENQWHCCSRSRLDYNLAAIWSFSKEVEGGALEGECTCQETSHSLQLNQPGPLSLE